MGDVVLPQVGQRDGERIVKPDAPLLDQAEDRRRGEHHLGQRGEIEPRIGLHRHLAGHELGRAGMADFAPAAVKHAQHGARNAPRPDRRGNRCPCPVHPTTPLMIISPN